MTGFASRRAMFGAALIAPALLPAAARAAAPQVGRQAPGFYRFKLGEFEVTIVNDGFFTRQNPAEGFVRNAEPGDVRAALDAAMLPPDPLVIPFNITFVNTGRQLILFDTGTGGQLAPTAGTMWDNMRAAGIEPASVDLIAFTHFHGDHVSGLTTREGEARFPNAELLVPAPEWAFWAGDRAPAQGAQTVRARFQPYPGARIRQIAPDAEVAPGIRGVPTHGHTPGHTSYTIESSGQTLFVLGDVTNHPALNLAHPDWHLVFDMDAQAAARTRRALFDRLAADRTPIIGYHWPFPALARVRPAGTGFQMVPLPWSSAV
jgi:glyoxylase-like metal-dependent hydrolase (beta-lactamase superfamily II)